MDQKTPRKSRNQATRANNRPNRKVRPTRKSPAKRNPNLIRTARANHRERSRTSLEQKKLGPRRSRAGRSRILQGLRKSKAGRSRTLQTLRKSRAERSRIHLGPRKNKVAKVVKMDCLRASLRQRMGRRKRAIRNRQKTSQNRIATSSINYAMHLG